MPLNELNESGIRQVCSQIGRRFNKLFSDLGEDDEIRLSAFSLVYLELYTDYSTGAEGTGDLYSVHFDLADPDSLVSGDKTQEQWIEQIKTDSDLLRQALK